MPAFMEISSSLVSKSNQPFASSSECTHSMMCQGGPVQQAMSIWFALVETAAHTDCCVEATHSICRQPYPLIETCACSYSTAGFLCGRTQPQAPSTMHTSLHGHHGPAEGLWWERGGPCPVLKKGWARIDHGHRMYIAASVSCTGLVV
jgi:hypothetical protein